MDDPLERRRDLQVQREEYALDKDKTEDKDLRWMKWIVFIVIILIFVASVIGTFMGSSPASYIMTVVISAVVGNRIQWTDKISLRSTRDT